MSEQPTSLEACHHLGDHAVISVAGDLDIGTRDRIDELVQDALASGARDLTFELSGVSFMDTQGLYAVLDACTAVDARGGRARLRAASPAVRRVIELSGLGSRLPLQRSGGETTRA